jgi:hypothetical protein
MYKTRGRADCGAHILEGGGGISGGWERETQEIFFSFIIFSCFYKRKKNNSWRATP